MKRRAFLQGAAGVGLVTAGGLVTLPGRPSHAAGDTVTVGINNDIVTWDPLSVSEWYTTAILPSVLETAVTNKDGAYIPWLLESIQPRETTVWRMRLRPGIKFQNGEPLDARALKWNLDLYADRAANYPNPGTRVLLPLMKEANVVDDRTVELVTTQASALVYEGLTRVSEQLAGLSSATASLESIMLDEGFGTLDAETLETVAITLENLAARGNRMVGVVTHVAALAERIPVRFELSRDARGVAHIVRAS